MIPAHRTAGQALPASRSGARGARGSFDPGGRRTRRGEREIAVVALLFALLFFAVGVAQAQPGDPPGRPAPDDRRWERPRAPRGSQFEKPDRDGPRERERPGRDWRVPGSRGGWLPLRPTPEDFGPLGEGEEAELLEFARASVPEMYLRMTRLRTSDSPAFHAQFEQRIAPHLRCLRRLFRRDPDLGREIVAHARTQTEIERTAAALRRQRADDVLEIRVRELLAENLRREIRVLEAQAALRRETRDADVERDLARLADPDADLSAEPPYIRRLVHRLREALAIEPAPSEAPDAASVIDRHEADAGEPDSGAPDGVEVAADGRDAPGLRAALRAALARRVDAEIAVLTNRAERLKCDPAREVDRRVERLLDPPRP